MKNTKIILIAALISLGTAIWGQPVQIEYITVSQTERGSRFENLANGFLSFADRTQETAYHEPVVKMSFIVRQADVIFEENYRTERWMTSPFEIYVFEDKLFMESWMAYPFDCNIAEPEVAVEKWMTSPFDSEDPIKIERWMTSSF